MTYRLPVRFLFSLFFCSFVHAAPPVTMEAFSAEVAKRIDAVSSLLDEESKSGKTLQEQVDDTPPQKLTHAIKGYVKSSDFRLIIKGELNHQLIDGKVQRANWPLAKKAFLDEVSTQSRELQRYGNSLQKVSSSVQTSSSTDEVLKVLRSNYVPGDAAIVIAIDGEPQSATGTLNQFSASGGSAPAQPSDLEPFIVGLGAATVDHPATAALLYVVSGGSTRTIRCTGALVADDVIVTAAHCLHLEHFQLVGAYFQHAGVYEIDTAVPHESFNFPYYDIALLKLKKPVTGIRPIPMRTSGPVQEGTAASIIGFGYHSGLSLTDPTVVPRAGMKFSGWVTTGACDPPLGNAFVCWSFVKGSLQHLSASICEGDSGGPLLVQEKDTWTLAGLTSGGKTCQPGDRPVDTAIYPYGPWIQQHLASIDATTSQVPPNDERLTPAIDNSARLIVAETARLFGSQAPRWERSFAVPAGTKTLRIAFNTVETGATLHFDAGASGAAPACNLNTDDVVAECEISTPTAGPWTIHVAGVAQQEYQLVATAF